MPIDLPGSGKQALSLHNPIADIVDGRLVWKLFNTVDRGVAILGPEAALMADQPLFMLDGPATLINGIHAQLPLIDG
jgi:hypothetical protein